MSMTAAPLADRVHKTGWTVTPDGCWEWNGSRMRKRGGYGQIRVPGATRKVHRVAYELWVGEIPSGMIVCHSCDNPPCINPTHLWVGTHGDNAKDKVAKGRSVNPVMCGEESPTAKLTQAQVDEIRARHRPQSGAALGREFGVSKTTISRIVRGKAWS